MRLALILPALLLAAACGQGAPTPADNAAAPIAQPAAPAAPAQSLQASLAGITNVDVQYYEVSGNSLFEIRRALNRVRPRDPNDGLGVDALAMWYIRWRWPEGPGGGCDLSRAEIEFSARIRLPRLIETPQTPPAVRMRWRAYVAALERHEASHIRHAWENRQRILDALRRSSCANANNDGMAAVRQLGRYDVDYDQRTRHGLTEGAHFP
jgi:predicted secreted Zn-dependent protease